MTLEVINIGIELNGLEETKKRVVSIINEQMSRETELLTKISNLQAQLITVKTLVGLSCKDELMEKIKKIIDEINIG